VALTFDKEIANLTKKMSEEENSIQGLFRISSWLFKTFTESLSNELSEAYLSWATKWYTTLCI